MKMKLSRSDNHIIITMMKLSRCVLDSIFHQTNKKLVDSIFLAVLGVVCLQNEGAIITSRPQHNIVTVTIYKGPGQSNKIFLSILRGKKLLISCNKNRNVDLLTRHDSVLQIFSRGLNVHNISFWKSLLNTITLFSVCRYTSFNSYREVYSKCSFRNFKFLTLVNSRYILSDWEKHV